MCCEYTDYAAEMHKAKREIIDEVASSIQALAVFDMNSYLMALMEIISAIWHGSFNNYQPHDPELWQLIDWPIRTRTEFDIARVYMLAALLHHLQPSPITAKLEAKYCQKMLSVKLPTRV